MRVIAGSARGHTLKAPKGYLTRPTLDKVREAIFNVIADHVPDSIVLDLFSGSGAMGIEALSRGAAHCVFNDVNKKAIQIIKDNLAHTKLAAAAEIYNLEALQLLNFLGSQNEKLSFNLVFIDPPYDSGLYSEVFKRLACNGLLSNGALLVAESNLELELRSQYDNLLLKKKSKYGDTLVWYYKYMEE